MALQLGEQWRVQECELRREEGLLRMHIGFVRGSKFAAPGSTISLNCPCMTPSNGAGSTSISSSSARSSLCGCHG